MTICGSVDWSILLTALPSRDAQRLEYCLIRIRRRVRRAEGRACIRNHTKKAHNNRWSGRFGKQKQTAIDVGFPITRQPCASALLKKCCEYFTAVPISPLDRSPPLVSTQPGAALESPAPIAKSAAPVRVLGPKYRFSAPFLTRLARDPTP